MKLSFLIQRTLIYKDSLRGLMIRELVKRLRWMPYEMRLEHSLVTRPQYGRCLLDAAVLANKLGHKKVSAIEFGVAGGRGLVDLEMHARQIKRIIDIDIEIYGFDAACGLPEPRDYRDVPFFLKGGMFAMDVETLKSNLKIAKLVLGDVRETVKTFVRDYNPAPIGAVFIDLDYYSSTKDALKLFDDNRTRMLPRAFVYADDIFYSGELYGYCEYNGEWLAINEFNAEHQRQKFARAAHLTGSPRAEEWHHKVFVYHDFDHVDYCRFVGLDTVAHQMPLH